MRGNIVTNLISAEDTTGYSGSLDSQTSGTENRALEGGGGGGKEGRSWNTTKWNIFTIVSHSVSVIAIKKFSIQVDNYCNQERERERDVYNSC